MLPNWRILHASATARIFHRDLYLLWQTMHGALPTTEAPKFSSRLAKLQSELGI
jgi:hypothetical protein